MCFISSWEDWSCRALCMKILKSSIRRFNAEWTHNNMITPHIGLNQQRNGCRSTDSVVCNEEEHDDDFIFYIYITAQLNTYRISQHVCVRAQGQLWYSVPAAEGLVWGPSHASLGLEPHIWTCTEEQNSSYVQTKEYPVSELKMFCMNKWINSPPLLQVCPSLLDCTGRGSVL